MFSNRPVIRFAIDRVADSFFIPEGIYGDKESFLDMFDLRVENKWEWEYFEADINEDTKWALSVKNGKWIIGSFIGSNNETSFDDEPFRT